MVNHEYGECSGARCHIFSSLSSSSFILSMNFHRLMLRNRCFLCCSFTIITLIRRIFKKEKSLTQFFCSADLKQRRNSPKNDFVTRWKWNSTEKEVNRSNDDREKKQKNSCSSKRFANYFFQWRNQFWWSTRVNESKIFCFVSFLSFRWLCVSYFHLFLSAVQWMAIIMHEIKQETFNLQSRRDWRWWSVRANTQKNRPKAKNQSKRIDPNEARHAREFILCWIFDAAFASTTMARQVFSIHRFGCKS